MKAVLSIEFLTSKKQNGLGALLPKHQNPKSYEGWGWGGGLIHYMYPSVQHFTHLLYFTTTLKICRKKKINVIILQQS